MPSDMMFNPVTDNFTNMQPPQPQPAVCPPAPVSVIHTHPCAHLLPFRVCMNDTSTSTSTSYDTAHDTSTYRLDNEAEGSTRNRNPRSHTIEPKREARGFYMASRVSMERRSRWPSCLTDLEYSNRCYAADVFRLQAFACLTLACFAEQSEERQ